MHLSSELHVATALPSTKHPAVTFECEADGDPGKIWKFWRKGRFISHAWTFIPYRAVVYTVIYN
jgi:hypothetical protein